MTFTIRRLASLVTALAISGAPAVLSACAALCVPGMTQAAMVAVSQAPSPTMAACCATPAEAPAAHAHHTMDAAEPHRQATAPADAAQIAATGHACCPDARTLDVASTVAARTDAGTLVASAPVASSPYALRRAESPAQQSLPLAARRSPARTPLVLRI